MPRILREQFLLLFRTYSSSASYPPKPWAFVQHTRLTDSWIFRSAIYGIAACSFRHCWSVSYCTPGTIWLSDLERGCRLRVLKELLRGDAKELGLGWKTKAGVFCPMTKHRRRRTATNIQPSTLVDTHSRQAPYCLLFNQRDGPQKRMNFIDIMETELIASFCQYAIAF